MTKIIDGFFDQLNDITGGEVVSIWDTLQHPNKSWDEKTKALNIISNDPDVGPMIKAFTHKLTDYCVKAVIEWAHDNDHNTWDGKSYAEEYDVFAAAKDKYLAADEAEAERKAIEKIAEQKGFMEK